jgi:hypothetical protein
LFKETDKLERNMSILRKIFGHAKSTGKSEKSAEEKQAFDTYLSIAMFVPSVIKGSSSRGRIEISEIPDVCMALMEALQRQGIFDEQQFRERLHGTCPVCGTRLTGSGILMVSCLKRFERAAFGGGSAMTQRVYNGNCANEKCNSKEIILEWRAMEHS